MMRSRQLDYSELVTASSTPLTSSGLWLAVTMRPTVFPPSFLLRNALMRAMR